MNLQIKILLVAFGVALILGIIILPILRRLKVSQQERTEGPKSHLSKKGTPTMGGLIFMIPTTITTLILIFMDKIEYSSNLLIILFVFIAYGILGFIDDYLIVIKHNNKNGY